VLLLVVSERVEEELGLIVMLLELGTTNALFDACNLLGKSRRCWVKEFTGRERTYS